MKHYILIAKTLHRPFRIQSFKQREIWKWVTEVLLKPIMATYSSCLEIFLEISVTLICGRSGRKPKDREVPCDTKSLLHYAKPMLGRRMLKYV